MQITEAQRYKLKHFIKELAQHRGRHTELISVYVPAGFDLNMIITHLQQEQGTATNIKSKSTRDNVTAGLEKMIQHLRTFHRTPPHGLAAFAGNVAEREGQQDYKAWSIEPPIPMNQRLYRCDKEFVLEPLMDLAEDKTLYGLVVVDRRDATVAFLKGKTIVPLVTTHSEVPGKTRAGGQSSARFARLREGATKDHYKKVADLMKDQFLGKEHLKGIIIGGPSTTVNDFMNKDYVTGDLKKKIIATRDLSYTGEFGLHELLEKSDDVLAEEGVMHEKKLLQHFFTELAQDTGKVEYGMGPVKKALEMGAVETLIVIDDHETILEVELEPIAQAQGTNIEVVGKETREGKQLADIGGIAAILRYRLS